MRLLFLYRVAEHFLQVFWADCASKESRDHSGSPYIKMISLSLRLASSRLDSGCPAAKTSGRQF